jgi:S-DNA-T family DNA segregation ATPase FtsK/SpoIIIE
MSRRRQPSETRIAGIGLALALCGLLLGLSFLPGATGVPVVLAAWQRRLLGQAAALLPAASLLTGLVLIAAGPRARFSRPIVGIVLAVLVGLAGAHALTAPGDLLRAGLAGHGTGLVGGLLAGGVARGLGRAGLWVVIGVLSTTAVGLLAGLTLASAGAVLRAVGRLLAATLFALARLLVATGQRAVWAAGWLARQAMPVAADAARLFRRGLEPLAGEVARLLARWRVALLPGRPAVQPAGPVGAAGPETAATAPAGSPPPSVREVPPMETTGPAAASDLDPRRRRGRAPAARPGQPVRQERLVLAPVEFQLPSLSMLGDANGGRTRARVDPADTARALEQTLASFGVEVKVVHWEVGPVVTRFEVQPAPGVKVQKITSLTNDIALNLAAQSVRIEAPIPGKSAVGIELPNQKASLVHLREIITTEVFQKATSPLVVGVGKDIAGHPIVADLTEMPHLLIAGATGSGKSVALNAMIASLLFRCTPQQVRFVMIDPKRVELTDYNDIPHLLTPVVTNPRQAAGVLKDMLRVMERRFERFAQAAVRNIQAYNQLADVEPLYYIVIIIDELADLMMVAPADFEDIICRLAQMTRATGIHLVVATQRPSVDVITGLIKANIPSRLAFAVSSQVDSRTILDSPGAEKLLGRGDMLFLPLGASRAIRAQGAYVADDEIRAVVEWWRQQGSPAYDQQLTEAQQSAGTDEGSDGERLHEAARLVVRSGYGSVSLLQRKMRIGYVTAARLIDELEARGIVGPVQGSNPREVLIGLDGLERVLRSKPPGETA